MPTDGEVKPELMEGVCEIATTPVRNTVEAGLRLRALRRTVNQVAKALGLAIGSAGTHPFALWEDQRIGAAALPTSSRASSSWRARRSSSASTSTSASTTRTRPST